VTSAGARAALRLTLLAAGAVVVGGAGASDSPLPPAPASDAGFCARAQQLLAGTPMVATNLVFETAADFSKSKPRIRPLETDQFVTRAEDGEPLRVSCKMKSADHIRAEYGAAAAGAERQCREVNRDTAARVYGALSDAERARLVVPPGRLLLSEDEEALTGSGFTFGADTVRFSPDGRLVVRALSIRVDWEAWWWAWMPERFRGQHSCHFIAPEYLRRLVLGEVRPE
jgi:hypothetical protein